MHTMKCNHFKPTCWCILTHVCTLSNTTSVNIRNFSVIPQSSLTVLCSQFPSEPHPRSPLVFVLTVLEFQINGLIQYELSDFRFLSVSTAPVRFTCVVMCTGNFFLFLLTCVLLYGYAPFVYPFICHVLWLFPIRGCYEQSWKSVYKSSGEHISYFIV